uniref:Esterase lipase thioesterase family protein n=1 Tax=Mycena chlorophos TaxID=658473 RepID=A0ABQ0M0L1_MYCCL|nr:esterase lipase thioesterase family protein [Mycena chlorophos]
MDAVAQLNETDVSTILFPTVGIFAPLLESRRTEIKDAVKTYKYGATDRHQLDVYLPSSQPGSKAPILFFLYGGGFVQGARQLPAPIDLAYGNLGTYFAKHGFVTVVADYQLAPNVTFPAPAEDVRDAVAWVVDNAAEVGSGKVELDTEKVFVIGHSAGGVHLLTSLLHPPVLAGLAGDKYKKALKGAVALSPPYRSGPTHDVSPNPKSEQAEHLYYGSAEFAAKHTLIPLLQAHPDSAAALPPLALVQCEYDPPWFLATRKEWDEALAAAGVPKPKEIQAKGHNHISVTLALNADGAQAGEKWAEEVVEWMKGL